MTYRILERIGSRRIRPLHWLVVGLSFCLMLIDGFDLICIAFVTPLLQHESGFPDPSSASC